MTETTFPQCRIVTYRLMNPETVERLLNKFFSIPGIRRMVLNGPRLPAVVPSGPSKGIPNPHGMRKTIKVGNQDLTLQVQVGTILLELESRDCIPALKSACDEVFTEFPYRLNEGRFMKTEPTLVDYAKYGPMADKDMLGLSDPGSRSGPIILQGTK
ncbi:MAG TPA: methyl-coenzyme M reductase operon protein D [Methanoregulaceae archaeon]|nr:methyl-coenzyme M reductase operon protein D [Methanoregulaceae archaeon]HPD74864.1 methyl-coenzyme M reductase operon protein D [Methanoregulaceae archaeon]